MRALGALVLALVTASIAAPAPAQTRQTGAVEAPSWRTLQRFSSEAEFYRYLRDVRAAERRARGAAFQKQDPGEECPPEFYPCEPPPGSGAEESVVVTGSRVPSPVARASDLASQLPQVFSETSITNVQNAGVDEGDIVKFFDHYLIVLQDGRLFSVDIADDTLRLVDRANVYRSPNAGTWYDEILVQGNRVVATGYNYREAATEFSVFLIGADGRFTREAVYFLSSNDYYDIENYATRLVNGNLVIYTPLAVGEMQAGARASWPLVRRWLSEGEHQSATSAGRTLYNATDIYRPVQSTFDPVVHTISVCPLGETRRGDELECRSTAVVAPPGREFYVSTSHIYLWTWPTYDYERARYENCNVGALNSFEAAAPAALFQIPLAGGQLRAQFVRGLPWDQLSMDATASEFRALSVWVDQRCASAYSSSDGLRLRYYSTPLAAFSATPRAVAERRYTMLPSVGGAIENRFTDDYLIYAGRDDWSSYAPEPGTQTTQSSRAVAVPTARPHAFAQLETPHSALRVERVGDNAVITGYRDWRGLSLSFVDLRQAPRIASTLLLPERYETEGRSHAFNAVVDAEGAGLLGLPTEMRRAQSGRWWWRSAGSDVSYVSFNAAGQLSDSGAMRGTSPKHPDYVCEVSCIDWYGNTRALFIRGRVFALSGTELIEGALDEQGQVRERHRVNLTDPLQPYSAASR
jgi:hypothetical protein